MSYLQCEKIFDIDFLSDIVFYVVQQYLLAALGKIIIINLTAIAIYDSSNFLD